MWDQVPTDLVYVFCETCYFLLPGTVPTHPMWRKGVSRLPTNVQVIPPPLQQERVPEALGLGGSASSYLALRQRPPARSTCLSKWVPGYLGGINLALLRETFLLSSQY